MYFISCLRNLGLSISEFLILDLCDCKSRRGSLAQGSSDSPVGRMLTHPGVSPAHQQMGRLVQACYWTQLGGWKDACAPSSVPSTHSGLKRPNSPLWTQNPLPSGTEPPRMLNKAPRGQAPSPGVGSFFARVQPPALRLGLPNTQQHIPERASLTVYTVLCRGLRGGGCELLTPQPRPGACAPRSGQQSSYRGGRRGRSCGPPLQQQDLQGQPNDCLPRHPGGGKPPK